MLILLLFFAPLQVFSENVFHTISTGNTEMMIEMRAFLDQMWQMSKSNELHDLFVTDFRFLDCDLKYHDRYTFLERYIRYSSMPTIKSAFKKDIISNPHVDRAIKYERTWTHKYFDVELTNGKRIGFDVRYNAVEKFWGGYKIDSAIVYNCPNTKQPNAVYTNIAPLLKMRQHFEYFWDDLIEDGYSLMEYFDKNFLFEGCPNLPEYCKSCGYMKFYECMIDFPRRDNRPTVVDAIEVQENYEWQIEVLLKEKYNVYFQVKKVDGAMKFYKAKEFKCPGY